MSPPDSVCKGVMFRWLSLWNVRPFVRLVRHYYHDISWTAWSILMKIDREYSLAPIDDLIRFWRSKVKVPGHCRVGRHGQILWRPYLMNYLSNLDETYRQYVLAPADDLNRFWRSKVKVIADCGEGIHVDAGARRSPYSSFIFIDRLLASFVLLTCGIRLRSSFVL